MNSPSFLPLLRIAAVCLPALVLAPCLPPSAAYAGESETDGNTVSLNFVNADIGAVIQAVAKISGRNFIIDPRVKGTLNIVTARPVAKSLTYGILLSALRLQGYAAVESKGLTKIVPEADAKLHAPPVATGRPVANGDQISTQVFQIHNESAAQLVAVIRPLVSPNNTVTAYAANNTLVVTDYAENLSRIARILESIDLPQGDVRVLPVQHASALDLAATLNRLLNDGGGMGGTTPGDASQKVSIVADARTNNLLVRTENPSRLAAVRSLVQTLDIPGAAGNIHVIYLKNADAAKVAQTLRAVLSGETSNTSGASSSASPSSTSTFASSGATQTGSPQGSSATQNPGQTTGGGMVQADILNNALIITAPEAIYNNLRRVAEQLDRRRAQVFVEALIAEVSTEHAAESGIQWMVGAAAGGSKGVGIVSGSNFSTGGNNLNQLVASSAAGTPQLPGSGVNVAIAAGTVSIPGIGKIPSLSVLAHFLETESKANILSTPNIVTLDNEEAKIVIGSNVPFVTGQYTNTGAGTTVANPFQTIERKDVGLTLKIKPQISEGGTVRLQIYQEASSIIEATSLSSSGPSTTKRSIESNVLVDDGAIIALGGLVEDSYSGGEEKIPLLGDIPVAGALFRYDTRKRTKTNLVVFLRPRILRDADSYTGLTGDRYDYIIGQQRSIDDPARLMRKEPPAPLLPSLTSVPVQAGSAAASAPIAEPAPSHAIPQ
ncbi:MAG: type II secretion system secretin GspD [Zoogloea sp.]|nr:type II secretion system secretin GspD [Zoogloea sp.]